MDPAVTHIRLLVPYFHTKCIQRIGDISLCGSVSDFSTQDLAPDNRSFNTFSYDKQGNTGTCVHTCVVTTGTFSGRLLVPGSLLFALCERGILTDLNTDQLYHLQIHANSAHLEESRRLFTDPATIRLAASTQRSTWLRRDTRGAFMIMIHSALGRFAQRYLSASIGLPTGTSGSWCPLLDADEGLARLVGFWDDEYNRLLATLEVAQRPVSPASIEMLSLAIGRTTFAQDYSDDSEAGPGVQPCSVCQVNEPRIACMPCTHLCLCATCAKRMYTLEEARCYPTGHAIPALGSSCPLCNRTVTILLHIHRS